MGIVVEMGIEQLSSLFCPLKLTQTLGPTIAPEVDPCRRTFLDETSQAHIQAFNLGSHLTETSILYASDGIYFDL